MRARTLTCAIVLVCTSWIGTPHASAQSRAAVEHYERGRDHYQAGRYPEAAEELELGRAGGGEGLDTGQDIRGLHAFKGDARALGVGVEGQHTGCAVKHKACQARRGAERRANGRDRLIRARRRPGRRSGEVLHDRHT